MLGFFVLGRQQSRRIVAALEQKISGLVIAWLGIAMLAATPQLVHPLTPDRTILDFAEIALPYLVIAIAPLLGYFLARAAFPRGEILAQPQFRLAVLGQWRKLSVVDAMRHPNYGTSGFMASLVIGILLNVPVRTFEFFISVPAVNHHAPGWSRAIFLAMAADAAIMGFIYMVCLVLALRRIPLFPRSLALAWTMDIVLQFAFIREFVAMPDLPAQVAEPLIGLLVSNLIKVAISISVWLPYLLLSDRVNVTYRCRAAVTP